MEEQFDEAEQGTPIPDDDEDDAGAEPEEDTAAAAAAAAAETPAAPAMPAEVALERPADAPPVVAPTAALGGSCLALCPCGCWHPLPLSRKDLCPCLRFFGRHAGGPPFLSPGCPLPPKAPLFMSCIATGTFWI